MYSYLDKDGYPTAKALVKIKAWEFKKEDDYVEFFEFIKDIWCYPDYFIEKDGLYEISTCGWSGNEDIIEAMQQNTFVFLFCWLATKAGGHYIFALPKVRNKIIVEFKIERND